jgi:hypothetical protein
MSAAMLLAGPATGDDTDTTKSTADVTGRVTLQGKPLPAGWVVFHGKRGRAAQTNIDDGKYVLKNAPVGEGIKVTIDTASIASRLTILQTQLQLLEVREKQMKQAQKEDAELTRQIQEVKKRVKVLTEMQKRLGGIKVDEKYAARDTTPLSVAIKPGAQTFDIELEK